MVYGMVLVGHIKWNESEQRVGIESFVKKIGLKINKFLLYTENPNLSHIKSGDMVIFYDWGCVCRSRKSLDKIMEQFIKNHICVYSVCSKYCIDKHCNFEQLIVAFNLFKDIQSRFLSTQNTRVVQSRLAQGVMAGRPIGIKNQKHVWDGYESQILSMYASGLTMYRISKELNIDAAAVRRFLLSQNKKEK